MKCLMDSDEVVAMDVALGVAWALVFVVHLHPGLM
jgi:hypothetical protein